MGDAIDIKDMIEALTHLNLPIATAVPLMPPLAGPTTDVSNFFIFPNTANCTAPRGKANMEVWTAPLNNTPAPCVDLSI